MPRAAESCQPLGRGADPLHVLKSWLAINGCQTRAASTDQPQTSSAQAAMESSMSAPAAKVQNSAWPRHIRFSQPGPLGLSLGTVDGCGAGGRTRLGVVAVKPGSTAAKTAGDWLQPGLVVVSVAGQTTDQEDATITLQRIKSAVRPLDMSFDRVNQQASGWSTSASADDHKVFRVLSDIPLVHTHLNTNSRFVVLPARKWQGTGKELDECEILFLGRRIQDFEAIPRRVQINQFVNDCCVTSKLLMHDMVLRHWVPEREQTHRPEWLPEQYVLPLQLDSLRLAWRERAVKCQDNSWIVRPAAGARSEGVWITNDWSRLQSSSDSFESARSAIASKYVEHPATIDGRKFDLRFYVMVTRAGAATGAAQVCCHREYYCRRAILPWRTDAVGTNDKCFPAAQHLTVHCYASDPKLRQAQVFYSRAEFESRWEAEHQLDTETSRRGHFECRVLGRIYSVLRELFQCAVTEIGDSDLWPSSRAIYGVDVLLEERSSNESGGVCSIEDNEYQPIVLEVNYSPDASTILSFYPDFYNDVFDTLYTAEQQPSEQFQTVLGNSVVPLIQ